VRYAVVGLGHIAQNAILPAFAHAKRNSELAALVSDDPAKLKALGRRYDIEARYSYEAYDACLRSGDIDAVYIALPNSLHRPYAVRAAEMGVHVLCEKPLAVTAEDCEAMIEAARRSQIRLMTAYRLHFERANMRAVELVKSGRLGEPRLFTSTFTMQVRDGDIRLKRETGGGTLYDIGVYCINAARYLFRAEPTEVVAVSAQSDDPRFSEVDEMTAAALRFPGDRIATFTCSFGAADVSAYRLVGTEGSVRVDPAYTYSGERRMSVTVKGRTSERTFPAVDQFAPELLHFSDAILERRRPEPAGEEGLADVRIIEALYRSAATRKPETVSVQPPKSRPTAEQVIERPPVPEQELVHAQAPHED
jgi:glucose-fructose oxidoreductase